MNRPQKEKNPAKVAAGKARAAKGLRLGGKFVTKYFAEHIKETVETLGTNIDPQTFLNQNEQAYTDLYYSEGLRSAADKAATTIIKDSKNYSGKVFLNDEESNPDELAFKAMQFENFCYSNFNCAGISYKPVLTFDGKMKLQFPTLDELEECLESDTPDEDLQELAERYGIRLFVSDRAGQSKEKAQKISRKKRAIKQTLKDAKQKLKGGTKPKKH